jgi:hypothetical protein
MCNNILAFCLYAMMITVMRKEQSTPVERAAG